MLFGLYLLYLLSPSSYLITTQRIYVLVMPIQGPFIDNTLLVD